MALTPELHRLFKAADASMRSGQWLAALGPLAELLADVHHPASIYDGWIRLYADAALRAAKPALAAPALEYLLEHGRAAEAWRQAGRPEAAARCRLRAGEVEDAARAFEALGAWATAAAAWEDAGALAPAARAWERAAKRFGESEDPYRAALALLNLGLVLLAQGPGAGREVLSRAIVALEEEADQAETTGDLARALACYHALIHVGRRTGSHENLAEGFLNCARLMKARDHRFFVLQYFHDFAEASQAAGEHQAAAEVLREAAEYCRRRGMLYNDHFLGRAAQAFEAAGAAHLEGGAPAELAENALLSALDCHNRRGDAGRVQASYQALSALPLPETRRARYRRVAEDSGPSRLAAEAWPFRGYFDEAQAYPPTWRDHVLEADGGKDALWPLPEAIGDPRQWDVARRRALVVLLHREQSGDPEALPARLARVRALGQLGTPLALSPLGRLARDPEPGVRRAVGAALRFLPFRGALEVLGDLLADEDPPTREEALRGLRHLVFPGAFTPLIRLYREHPQLEARREVVLCLGRLVGMEQSASADALDFLLHTWREGVDPLLEEDLRTAVAANVSEGTLSTLLRHLNAEPEGPLRTFLARVVSRVESQRDLERLHP